MPRDRDRTTPGEKRKRTQRQGGRERRERTERAQRLERSGGREEDNGTQSPLRPNRRRANLLPVSRQTDRGPGRGWHLPWGGLCMSIMIVLGGPRFEPAFHTGSGNPGGEAEATFCH